jgi:hypothetical protein
MSENVEQIVTAYLRLREAIEEKEDQHKQEIGDLKEQLDLLSNQLLTVCAEQGLDGLKTNAGTVSRRVQSRYWTSDWPSMYQFIKDHDAMYLLEQRIHNNHMKQFLEENPDTLPIGLQAERKFVIQVRKPTRK